MNTITLLNHVESAPIDETLLLNAAETVLKLCDAPQPANLTLVLCDDAEIQSLNQQFRGIDAPTDVLSFPAEPLSAEIAALVAAAEGEYELGDVLIGLPYTQRRVAEAQHSLDQELALLVIHGVLHLLGHDHDTAENQAAMWAVQAQALQALSIKLDVPAYIHDD